MATTDPDSDKTHGTKLSLEPRAEQARKDPRETIRPDDSANPYLIEREAILLRRSRWPQHAAPQSAAPERPERGPPTTTSAVPQGERGFPREDVPPQMDHPTPESDSLRHYERPPDRATGYRKELTWDERVRGWLRHIFFGQ